LFDHVQILIQDMKDLIFAPMVQDANSSILASNSSQLEEEVNEYQPRPKRSRN